MQQAENPANLRPHKLPKFSGEGGFDVDDFVREARLALALQPLPGPVAATWLLSALEGQARQEIIRRPAADVNTAVKIIHILEDNWGEQRDGTTLAAAFYRRQQGIGETVGEYSSHLQILQRKANEAQVGIIPEEVLPSTLANGLHPASLRRDMKRFLREHEGATFEETKREAQRWMREDHCDIPSEQLAGDKSRIARLEAQLAAVATQQRDRAQPQTMSTQYPHWQPRPTQQQPPRNYHQQDHWQPRPTQSQQQPPRNYHQQDHWQPRPTQSQQQQLRNHHQQDHWQPPRNHNQQDREGERRRQNLRCNWCDRPGHTEDQCRCKQRYARGSFRQGRQGQQQGNF